MLYFYSNEIKTNFSRFKRIVFKNCINISL